MKILFQIALDNLKKFKHESLLVISSITLTVSIITMILVIMSSSMFYMIDSASENYPVNVEIYILDIHKTLDIINKEKIEFYTIKNGAVSFQYDNTYVNGLTWNGDITELPPNYQESFKLSEGRLSNNENELVVSNNSKYNIGDEIEMTKIKNGESFAVINKVVGRSVNYTSYFKLNEDKILNFPETYIISIIFKDGTKNVDKTMNELKGKNIIVDSSIVLNSDYNFLLGMQSTPGKSLKSFIVLAFLFIILIALSTSSLIINAYNTLLTRKEKLYSTLRSIGTTKSQMKFMMFIESSCLSIVGITLGILIGTLISSGTLKYIVSRINYINDLFSYSTFNISMKVDPYLLLLILIINYILIVATVLIKSKNIFKGSSIQSLNINIKNSKNQHSIEKNPIKSIAKINNSYTNQYKGIKTSLIVTMILLISVNTYALGLNKYIENNTSNYDTTISGYNEYEDSYRLVKEDYLKIKDDLKSFKGIKNSIYTFEETAYYDTERHTNLITDNEFSSSEVIDIIIVDDEYFSDVITANDLSSNIESIFLNSFNYTEVDEIMHLQKFEIEDNEHIFFNRNIYDNEVEFSIEIDKVINDGLVKDKLNITFPTVLLKESIFTERYEEHINPDAVLIYLQTNFTPNELGTLNKLFISNDTNLTYHVNSDLTSLYTSSILTDVLLNVSLLIFLYIILIVLISIINTTLTSIRHRKKDLAILKSIGTSNKQIVSLLFYESVYSVIPAWVTSLQAGNLLVFTIIKIFNIYYPHMGVVYSFDFNIAIISLLFILIIMIVQMLIIINENKRLNMIEDIRNY